MSLSDIETNQTQEQAIGELEHNSLIPVGLPETLFIIRDLQKLKTMPTVLLSNQ